MEYRFTDIKLLILMYIVVINIVFVRVVGRYVSSALAYPFSNICARVFLKKNLNAKFGSEFSKRIDHMATLVSAFSAEGCKMSPECLA
jgi:hypothetical protein